MTKNLAKRLDGKVCIITGSANGIGFATAQKFCDEGGISIICDMNADQVKNAVLQLQSSGGQAEGFVMNVTDRQNIEQFAYIQSIPFSATNGINDCVNSSTVSLNASEGE